MRWTRLACVIASLVAGSCSGSPPGGGVTQDALVGTDGTIRDLIGLDADSKTDAGRGDTEPGPSDAGADHDAAQARLFGADAIIPVDIELSDAVFEQLRQSPHGGYVEAAITVDGRRVERVGLRLKGSASFRSITSKAAFKIDVDRFDPGATVSGLRKLTFNNMIQDPTKMRERLASVAFARLDVPAPRVGYAEIRVNGKPYGLYANVETPDEVFLERVYPGDSDGNLYEGEYPQDLWPRDRFALELDAGDDDDREDLTRLLAALDEASPATLETVVGAAMDLDEARRFWAGEFLTGHWDGYARTRNNYYLYGRPSDGRFVFMPWGTDQAWTQTPDPLAGLGRAFKMCVSWLPCRQRYAVTLREMAARFEAWDWRLEVKHLEALTAGPFARDEKTPHTPEQREAAITNLLRLLEGRPASIVSQIRCMDEALDLDGDLTLPCAGDCDDADPTRYPGAFDTCDDDIDQDCSGYSDDHHTCPECQSVEAPGGAVFLACHRELSYGDPEALCKAHGGELASIRTAEEQETVAAFALGRRRTRWHIGLRRDDEAEGGFRWLDGAPMTYLAWAAGQPDNAGHGESCGCLGARENGAWSDIHCGLLLPVICRLPAPSR